MITSYLIDLLKDNECVIVPDFGAFISKRVSASIDYANHRFEPPYKEIVFNKKLKNNDEILVDYISKKESISKDESLAKIVDFVHQTETLLDVNSEIELEGFGKLRKFGDDYVFETNKNVNMLGDAFGLSAFNIQPVFRTETYQLIKEQIYVEQKAKNTEYTIAIENVENESETVTTRKPNLFRTIVSTTLAFFLIFVVNWTTDRGDSNFASWNPFLYSSPNEYLLSVMERAGDKSVVFSNPESQVATPIEETVHVTEEITVTINEEVLTASVDEAKPSDVEEAPVKVEEVAAVEVVTPLSVEVEKQEIVEKSHYYIVGGSFKTQESANKCINGLKRQGFENASSLEMNDKGNIRVYYESFAKKSDALIRLEAIKKEYNESAWLLFQK